MITPRESHLLIRINFLPHKKAFPNWCNANCSGKLSERDRYTVKTGCFPYFLKGGHSFLTQLNGYLSREKKQPTHPTAPTYI